MVLTRHNDEDKVPSRPSSASSFNSYSSQQQSRDGGHNGGYSGGYGQERGGYGQDRGGQRQDRGGYGQERSGYGQDRGGYGNDRRGQSDRGGYDDRQSATGRFEDKLNNAGQGLMHKNAGTLGLDPSNMPAINKDFYKEHPEVTEMSLAEVEAYRKDAQMVISGKGVPNFRHAHFPEVIERKLASSGFAAPTPIQAQGWSMALSGQNMVGIAQTGSGKTLSFVLPAIVHIMGQTALGRGDGPIALILAPTRELAVQIQEVTRQFGNAARINSTCLYGGAPKSQQIRNVRQGCEIIVATPGRLLDLINMDVFNLKRCSFLVLDEADRMLDMGFEPQIRQILNLIRTDRQVLMWSATWPKNVMKLAHDMLGRDFIQVKIGSADLHANKKIKQNVIICEPMDKKENLNKILQEIWDAIPTPEDGKRKQMTRTIIFCNKKSTVDSIYRALYSDNWPVVVIHGDKVQHERDQAIRMFKNGEISILVATDVAARGLDVKDVMAVINFDLPDDIENYVHRIGRTARGTSTEGTSYAFVTREDSKQVNDLVKILTGAGQEVPAELAQMGRFSKGPSRSGYASYGRSRGGYQNNSGQQRQHIRFNPY